MENLDREQRWQYYVSSYMQIEPTEGVDRSRVGKSVLARNLPSSSDVDSESGDTRRQIHYHEGLTLMICMATSKITYEAGTAESHIYSGPTPRRIKTPEAAVPPAEGADAAPAAEGADAAPAPEANANAVLEASVAKSYAGFRREVRRRRKESHKQKLKEKMIMNQPWMKDLDRGDVQKKTDELRDWVDNGVLPGIAA